MKKLLAIWALAALLSPVFAHATTVNLAHGVVALKELVYTPYVWFWVASVILMGLGVWAFLKARYSIAFIASCVAIATTFVTGVSLATLPPSFATLATTTAFFIAGIALISAFEAPVKREYLFLSSSGIYGACMTASMISFMLL